VSFDDVNVEVMGNLSTSPDGDLILNAEVDGYKTQYHFAEKDGRFTLFNNETHSSFNVVLPSLGDDSDANQDANFNAPMNGTIVALLVEPGQKVEKGEPILIMEAMKMEHSIVAPEDGMVESFYFKAGELVDGGATLLSFAGSEKE
jgi:3-methylcrotonyl-CoA carboxylase alpha subunit